MAVVRLDIKTRQPLADGRKFDHVGCYEQLDGTAHFAVDPAHRLNCAVTDIDLAERGRDGLVHFTADVRILAPADQARGNHRLLFDVPNRGNRLALATFNGVPRPINPAKPTDAGNGFLMCHGYTVVWCGWQHDVPEADGLMRIKVPEAQIDGRPVSGRLLVGFQPSKPSQVQLLSDRGHRPYPSDDLDNPNAVLLVRDGEEAIGSMSRVPVASVWISEASPRQYSHEVLVKKIFGTRWRTARRSRSPSLRPLTGSVAPISLNGNGSLGSDAEGCPNRMLKSPPRLPPAM